MDLRQLEYVVAVADHGTFTAAAAACHVAQPSLSQAVRLLERQVGTPLFHRLGRHNPLTSAGEALLPRARAALAAVASIQPAVDAIVGVVAGRLDLVALPTLAVDPLVGMIGRFRAAHPAVTIRLAQPEHAGDLAARLADGRSELGLTDLGGPLAGLVTVPLSTQELMAVCPPGTRLPPGPALAIKALAELALVTSPQGTSTRRLLDEALAGAGLSARPLVAVEIEQREAIVPLVLAGAGCTVLPSPAAERAAAAGALVRPLTPRLSRTIAFVHRPGPLTPAAARFLADATAPRT